MPPNELDIVTREPAINALAPWFGSNRLCAAAVGEELDGCSWVGIVFAGSMTEKRFIKARSVVVNDLHLDIINLARIVADDGKRRQLVAILDDKLFHPVELAEAQVRCKAAMASGGLWHVPADTRSDVQRAADYFVCVWMGRSANAGTDGEFDGGLAMRWSASGGGSNVRYRSAVASLATWGAILASCEFTVLDCFDFLEKVKDEPGIGIYLDPPFPDAGEAYRFKFTEKDHKALARRLVTFRHARVVCRFHDHPLVRELYPTSYWRWRHMAGRDQANQEKPEVLLIRNPAEYEEGRK